MTKIMDTRKENILRDWQKGIPIKTIAKKYYKGKKAVQSAKKLIERYKTKTPSIDLHNLEYKTKIIKKPKKWLERAEGILRLQKYQYELSQFQKNSILFSYYGCDIRITKNFLYLIPKSHFFSQSVLGAVRDSEKSILPIIKKMEDLFGLKLSEEYGFEITLNRRHLAYEEHPLVKLIHKMGHSLNVYDKESKLVLYSDRSDGKNHLETAEKTYSSEFMPLVEDNLRHVTEGFSMKTNHEEIKQLVKHVELFGQHSKTYAENIKLHLNVVKKMEKYLKIMMKPEKKITFKDQEACHKLTEFFPDE
jgi:hypothetical protein